MYTLLACADLFGEKTNLELTFAAMPTVGELQRKVVDCFTAEAQLKRPQGYPAVEFHIARLQVYDDVLLKWADLVTATQLHEYDQLYVFQPQSPWHIDVQKDLPPPRPPSVQARAPPATGPYTPATGTFEGGATPSRMLNSAASPATPENMSHIPGQGYASSNKGVSHGHSPVQDRLTQNRTREEQLRAELARIAEESSRLEREAEAEREAQRRRAAEEADSQLRAREVEIQRQREALRRMEEEYQRDRSRAH